VGDGRLFVVEQGGRVKIVEASGAVSGTFLDINNRVRSGGEEGLLGLALSSDYETSGRFFVYYTRLDGNNQISSFRRISNTQADPASEQPVLTISHPTFSNHNGGDLNFRGGLLYASIGDGGSGFDPSNNAQNRESLLGKILRLDVSRDDFPADPARNYGIPPSNPYATTAGRDEIWALGLRNPWRFSFDAGNGNMFIGDVGQGSREEIDFEPANDPGGNNYGWRCYEGSQSTNISKCAKAPAYDFPIKEYERTDPRCAVTGGYVYRGAANPSLAGLYLFMDFCSGELFAFQPPAVGGTGPTRLLGTFPSMRVSTFGQGHNRELYVGDLATGNVYRLDT
jgi:glucose/arabinose dehydrogenase